MVYDEGVYYKYVGKNDTCRWLKTDDQLEMDELFYQVFMEYDLITNILEASSRDSFSCGHPGNSHSNGRGIDISYYSTDYLLNLDAVWFLLERVHDTWPTAQVIVGVQIKNDLGKMTGVWSPWIQGNDEFGHVWNPNDPKSHIHIGLNGSEINQQYTLANDSVIL